MAGWEGEGVTQNMRPQHGRQTDTSTAHGGSGERPKHKTIYTQENLKNLQNTS